MPARPTPPLCPAVLAVALALALPAAPVPGLARDLAPPRAIAVAVTQDDLARLSEVLALPALFDVVAREGAAYGEDLRASLFPDRAAASWPAEVAAIYAPGRLLEVFLPELGRALGETPADPILAYFESPEGRQIIALELAAREAILDPAIEEAARARWATLDRQDHPVAAGLRAFVAANDLIEANVAGTLNSNLAFYTALAAGGGAETPADEILASVLAQEPEIRAETEEWVYGYLALAYEPLPEGALDRYTAFSLTPEGQALNTALFVAFDVLFVDISRQLGRAAAVRMASEEL